MGDPALVHGDITASRVELLAARKYTYDAAGLGDNVHHSLDRRWTLDHPATATSATTAPTAMMTMPMIRRPAAFRRHGTATDRIGSPRTATARGHLEHGKARAACPVSDECAGCTGLVSILRCREGQRDRRDAGALLWLGLTGLWWRL